MESVAIGEGHGMAGEVGWCSEEARQDITAEGKGIEREKTSEREQNQKGKKCQAEYQRSEAEMCCLYLPIMAMFQFSPN